MPQRVKRVNSIRSKASPQLMSLNCIVLQATLYIVIEFNNCTDWPLQIRKVDRKRRIEQLKREEAL